MEMQILQKINYDLNYTTIFDYLNIIMAEWDKFAKSQILALPLFKVIGNRKSYDM